MMIVTLEYDGVPSLVEPPVRTPGLHLSDVIHRLLVFRGEIEDDPEARWNDPEARWISESLRRREAEALWDIGRNHEFAVARRLELDHPGRFRQLGELELDGIKMNLDLLDQDMWRPWEVKWTRLSAKNEPDSPKFWKYETQLMGYCRAIGSLHAALDVTHSEGHWERDWSKRKPVRRVWSYQFTEQEIDERWRLILTTARQMREEQRENGNSE